MCFPALRWALRVRDDALLPWPAVRLQHLILGYPLPATLKLAREPKHHDSRSELATAYAAPLQII